MGARLTASRVVVVGKPERDERICALRRELTLMMASLIMSRSDASVAEEYNGAIVTPLEGETGG